VGTVTAVDFGATPAAPALSVEHAAGFDLAAEFLLDQTRLADSVGTLTADQADILARAVILLRARANNIRSEAKK
jgi:hypothetical protein